MALIFSLVNSIASKILYTYDELNRLKTVKIDWLAAKPVATYTWKDKEVDLLDNLVAFNGITTSYTFDTAHRLKGITIPSVASYQFTLLDGNGNRAEVTQTEPLLPTLGGGTTAYTPNATKNRLMTAGANGFTCDNEGQLKTGYGATYTFDYDHRLSGFGANSYSYDGNSNRLKAIRSGVTTRYIYDAAGNLLAEADGSNVITRYYIHGQGLLAMTTPANQVYCYHYNATASTVALTDQSQAVVNKYAYDAFGAVANQVEAIPQSFTYVGQFGVMREPNGFYYMKARYYDPNVGRFISEDPIGFAGGDVNVSAYVQNNPIMLIDPNGKDAVSATLGGISAAAGLVALYPPAAPIARAVSYTTAGLAAAYATHQAIKENKISFDNASGLALAAGDIAVLTLEHKFPMSSALLNSIVRPLNIVSTGKDIAVTLNGSRCGR